MEREPEPERPERLLSRLGVASRREVARWISAGRLAADGRVLAGGEPIRPVARLTLDGRRLVLPVASAARRVLVYHKPPGEVVSRRACKGQASVFARLPRLRGSRWIAVGRLDVATSGLLLFTTDGDLAARLMHPRHGVERRYLVRVHGNLSRESLRRLLHGVRLAEGMARFSSCTPVGPETPRRNRWCRVSLREGRNREVRRLFAAVGVEVSRLKRIGYGPVDLPCRLAPGTSRYLTADEIAGLEDACREP